SCARSCTSRPGRARGSPSTTSDSRSRIGSSSATGSTRPTCTATSRSSACCAMAEEAATRRGGGFQRFILWRMNIGCLGVVFGRAWERNEHRCRTTTQGSALVIERGRFFPTGSSAVPPTDKVYGPLPVPAGEKPPADLEFESQNDLDRWLFDLLSNWAR